MIFKRSLTMIIAAALLAVPFGTARVSGADDAELTVHPLAPISVEDGEILLDGQVSASELKANFRDSAKVSITSASGEELTFADPVGSGSRITMRGDDGDGVVVYLPGDADGDAKVNLRDVGALVRSLAGYDNVIFEGGADVSRDGKLNAKDAAMLIQYLAGWDVVIAPEKESIPAENEDSAVGIYFDFLMHRIAREDTTVYGEGEGLMRMAKNEIEDIQLVLTSTEKKSGLTLEVGEIANEDGAVLEHTVLAGHYYELGVFNDLQVKDFSNYKSGYFTDPYPRLEGAFDIGENESKSIAVQVKAKADAAPGWYSAPVILRDADGNEIKRSVLRVYVWDFALDEETACDTLFCLGTYNLATSYEAYDQKSFEPLYASWYDYMLENRISAYHLPYEITDPRADEYMSNPRVTAFITLGGENAAPISDEGNKNLLRARYAKLAQNPDWLDKGYIYTVDEPVGDGLELVKNQWNTAKEVLGDIPFHTIVPYGNRYDNQLRMDSTEIIWDYNNGWCPISEAFTRFGTFMQQKEDPYNYPPFALMPAQRQYEKYGDYIVRYNQLRERGDKMWWYVCCAPEYPYPNFFNNYQGVNNRLVLWQQYMYDIDGILYWSVNMWTRGEHDTNPITLKRTNEGGDGTLIYNGKLWNQPGPTTTMRFETIRDGIEDFQYLTQLESLTDRPTAAAYVDRVSTGVLQHTEDPGDIDSARREVGFMLEYLYNGEQ